MKAIGFDLDGTLVNSLGHTLELLQNSVAALGIDFEVPPREKIVQYFGLPEEKIFAKLFGPVDGARVCTKYVELFGERLNEMPLFEGVQELLEDLTARKVVVGLYTARGRTCAELILKHQNIESHFQAIVTGTDVEMGKPHPEGLSRLAQELGVDAERMYYLGDSPLDIRMAHSTKSRAVAALWCPHHDPRSLRRENPHHEFKSVSELQSFLGENLK
jgi:HAD superfamily hydrolase (TIGR01549 family)